MRNVAPQRRPRVALRLQTEVGEQALAAPSRLARGHVVHLAEDLELLETDPGRVRAQCYDLVCNGVEWASGSIRIHRRDVQARVFSLLGIDETRQEERFGHILHLPMIEILPVKFSPLAARALINRLLGYSLILR
jgi:hypothetical protein